MNTHPGGLAPSPSYVAGGDSPLRANPAFDGPLARAERTLVTEFVIPIRSGRAWTVPAGHICRFSIIEGPQVLDLNLWSGHDPRERFLGRLAPVSSMALM